MAKIGLDNFRYALMAENAGGTVTYGVAKKPGKAISCSVSISNNSATLYADNTLAESDTSFQSGTVTLGIDEEDIVTQAELLGHTVSNGVIVRNRNDVAPYVGIGRIVKKMVNGAIKWKVEFLSKVRFSEPSQDDNTQGESIEFGTVEIEGIVSMLPSGEWSKAKAFDTYSAAETYLNGLFTNAETKFYVYYSTNGGTGTKPTTQEVTPGATVTLDDGSGLTPPDNKTFVGWATNTSATEAMYEGGESIRPTGDLTLYATYVESA